MGEVPVRARSGCDMRRLSNHPSHGLRMVAFTALMSAAPVVAAAQSSPTPQATPAQTSAEIIRARQESSLRVSKTVETAPGVSSPYALPTPEVTLQTTKEGTEATAVIGVANPFWGFRTTFKTPIGKDADAEASPLSLSGLENQATVDVAVIRKRVFRNSGRIDDLRLAFCADRRIPEEKCSDQAFAEDEPERERFLNYGMYPHPTVMTAHVQVGGKSFDFVEKGGSKKQTEKFTSIAAGGSYGWLFLHSQSVVAVNVDIARDYAASRDSTLLCQPIATDVSGTERCDTRIIGHPTASRKATTTLDFRKVFTRIEQGPAAIPERTTPVVGMSVQLRIQAIEHKKSVWGVEAPVYFLQKKPDQNKSVALNGGAAAGWNSRDGFVARVFIGTAFALLGKDFGQ
jgi:hypothetical protein